MSSADHMLRAELIRPFDRRQPFIHWSCKACGSEWDEHDPKWPPTPWQTCPRCLKCQPTHAVLGHNQPKPSIHEQAIEATQAAFTAAALLAHVDELFRAIGEHCLRAPNYHTSSDFRQHGWPASGIREQLAAAERALTLVDALAERLECGR